MQLIVAFALVIIFSSEALCADITGCGTLSTSGTTYVLQNDVTANGTCFTVDAHDVTVDLNGKTVTYDNAAPITVENGSFENALSGSWDTTGAPNAAREVGVYLDPSVYDGSYAIKVATPTANQQIQSVGTVTLQPNTTYSLSGMVYNTVSDSIQMSIGFDGTAIVATQTARTWRGFQYIYSRFTTGADPVSYKINLSVTGASSVSTGSIYFDDIRVQQSGHHGVHGGVSWSRTPTVKNGTIIQGQAHGDFSHAVYSEGISNITQHEISGLSISVKGNSTKAISLPNINYIDIYNNSISSSVDTIYIRDNFDGALIYIGNGSSHGSIHDNTIISGVQTGIYAMSSGESNRIEIYNNDITLQSRYVNDFAITGYKSYGTVIHNNIIRCGSGYNTCRGIYSNSMGGSIYDNTIDVHYKARYQEYSGCPVGGAYGIQLEDTAIGVEVYGNTVNATADECDSAAFRHFGPDSTTGVNNYIHGNTFTALAINGSTKVAASIRIKETFAQHLNFTENLLSTNNCWLYIDGINTASTGRSLLLDGNIFRVSTPKSDTYHPLISDTYAAGIGAPRNVSVINSVYMGGTVLNDMDGVDFVSRPGGYADDTYAYNTIVSGTGYFRAATYGGKGLLFSGRPQSPPQ